MELIDGKKIAAEIRSELNAEVTRLKEKFGRVPGLAAVLVGDNPASQVYVRMKHKACEEIGIYSEVINMPKETSEETLLSKIDELNQDEKIDGILVQLPLPDQIDEDKIIEAIAPEKDVDGFHPLSVGNLVIGKDTFFPCTPYGIMELIKRYKIETRGKHVVVVGRSNIVGKPIANMMLQKKEGANAIVTVCHSAAPDLKLFTKQADILIAAIGRANFITAEHVKEGAVVIDVGINRVEDENSKKGYKIVGDVDFENVAPKSSFITPVPGGVGPMTIAMLMKNTVESFIKKID
ncbi:MAG: bifunctional methylenetetrahydrofolate dehydrogenase/methenyltetrahydrofolate cyclohydrolase FolD [Ignavibacteria bacterium]|nr:MAG: bifunctional methylenetetrahydrofolate dehydrogenase/methenyltetrahydrofolate cyclohydrolase FolD [Ignavibacteria bacterium]